MMNEEFVYLFCLTQIKTFYISYFLFQTSFLFYFLFFIKFPRRFIKYYLIDIRITIKTLHLLFSGSLYVSSID